MLCLRRWDELLALERIDEIDRMCDGTDIMRARSNSEKGERNVVRMPIWRR